MASSSWSAAVLTLVAVAAALAGATMLREGSEFGGLVVLACAIVVTGTGCTAAVLWARGGRGN